MTSSTPSDLDAYEVVGATLQPDDTALPMRLRPVLKTRIPPYTYVLLDDDDDDDGSGESLWPEDESFIEDQIVQGRFLRLPRPLPARPRYWLIQLEARAEPHYLPEAEARAELLGRGRAALGKSARALAEGRLEAALEHATYAAIAMPEDAFPRLALIALLRPQATESQVWLESLPLAEIGPAGIAAHFHNAKQDPELAPLVQRIRKDPLADEYELNPAWYDTISRNSRGHSHQQPSYWWGKESSAA